MDVACVQWISREGIEILGTLHVVVWIPYIDTNHRILNRERRNTEEVPSENQRKAYPADRVAVKRYENVSRKVWLTVTEGGNEESRKIVQIEQSVGGTDRKILRHSFVLEMCGSMSPPASSSVTLFVGGPREVYETVSRSVSTRSGAARHQQRRKLERKRKRETER